jgi:hypothetical protein
LTHRVTGRVVNAAAPPTPAVLSQLYLRAVLPCLTELAEHDSVARATIADVDASVVFRILGGSAVTVQLRRGQIGFQVGALPGASVVLLFLSDSHLNAFFSGARWAIPILVWGAWHLRVLARFTRLADRLKAVLDGHASVIGSAEGRRLHARLSLMAAGLGLLPLSQGDEVTRRALRTLPFGLASFDIAGEPSATAWFEYTADGCAAGWGEPPRRPEVCITFCDVATAFAAMRDQIDTLAAVGRGQIIVDGLVPLADELSFVMQRLRIYLQPTP